MASVLYTKVLAPKNSSPKPPASGASEAKGNTAKPDLTNQGKHQKAENATTVPSAPPIQAPPPVNPQSSVVATRASAADLSRLSAQVLSIALRDEGSLRVTVSFKNAGEQRLSAILDAESSVLTDDQGQRYSILDSDLPASGSSPRLDLAAGAAGSHTFDFQAPKLGSKQFYLALSTPEGHRIRVAGSPMTLAGSP
jgi:hypothetical protein